MGETLGALEFEGVDSGTQIERRAVLRRPQLSQSIKMLKRKPRWIGATMAHGAAYVLHVIEQPGANRPFAAVLNSGEIHICRWIRGRLAHENFIHLDAALGGRGRSRVSEERQKTDLCENTRPLRRLRQRVRSPVAGGGERDTINRSQWVVHERVVLREE